jgi:hypothetical protein
VGGVTKLRVSWLEILGLLIGLAVCYGVISYALTYAPENRGTASKETRENTQQGAAKETTSTVPDEETKTVTIRVTGPSGLQFGVNYGNLDSSHSDEGVVPANYRVQVRIDPSSNDYVSVTVWKTTGDSKELKVQLVDGGSVVKENSTTKDYGAASIRWSPSERQPGGTTTPGTQKAKENSKPRP